MKPEVRRARLRPAIKVLLAIAACGFTVAEVGYGIVRAHRETAELELREADVARGYWQRFADRAHPEAALSWGSTSLSNSLIYTTDSNLNISGNATVEGDLVVHGKIRSEAKP